MTTHLDAKSEQDDAQIIAKLHREIEQLKQEHKLRVRRIEIEAYKAENRMALMLRQAGAPIYRSAHKTSRATSSVDDEITTLPVGKTRSRVERILFRRDGRPRKPLRLLLFKKSGGIRWFARRIVLRKIGLPRNRYIQWMNSSAYQRLPDAYRF